MTPDVIVVGGGFAGLSAAVRLAEAGACVHVVEAKSRLGGRATAFAHRETGELVDNGQHVLVGCYHATRAFLDTIGAGEHVRWDRRLAVDMIDEAGVPSRLECPDLPVPLHLLAGVFDWPALTWSDRWSVLGMAGALRTAAREAAGDTRRKSASPGETVRAWLVQNGQSDRLREMLWEPLALAALNQPATLAAAPPFARVLGEMFGGDRQAAAIGLPSRPLHQMYAEPARTFVEAHGGVVTLGATARVVIEDHRALAVVGAERASARTVVVAVPWFALPDLFDGDTAPLLPLIDAARATEASPIVTVNIWFDRPVLERAFVGLPGRTMQWVFDKRTVIGDSASHVSTVSSGAREILERTNDDIVALALSELGAALPTVRTARVLRTTVIREPRATFSLAPGQPARPGTATAVPNLFLAGDWVDTGLPATIESAVVSGFRAADAVIRSQRDMGFSFLPSSNPAILPSH